MGLGAAQEGCSRGRGRTAPQGSLREGRLLLNPEATPFDVEELVGSSS
jgi:hypothetical protein